MPALIISSDDVISTTDLSDLVAQISYHSIDASVTLLSADEHWDFSLATPF